MSKKKKNTIKNIKALFDKTLSNIKNFFKEKKKIKLTPFKTAVLCLILFLGIVYLLRSLIFAAFVNGKPIFRLSVISVTEKQDGTVALDNLIEKQLIFDEANKQKIKVTEEDVENEITNIKDTLAKQNITLDQALEVSKQDLNSLKEQIKIQKIVEKILGNKVTIEDKEISEYFLNNKEYFGTNAKLADFKDQIKNELFAQKLSSEYSKWIEELKTNAKIKYFVKY